MKEFGLFFKLPKDWKEIASPVFDEGGSFIEAYLKIGLTKQEHDALCSIDEYYEFMDNGMAISEAYWLKWSRDNIENKDANMTIFKEMMKRLFMWDRTPSALSKPAEVSTGVKEEEEKFNEKFLKVVK